MKLRHRSFPHPVLGNADDVSGAAFQAVFEPNQDREFYYLKTTFQCSSRTLLELIEKKKAAYVLHVECSNTVFRERCLSYQPDLKHPVDSEKLNGTIEVNFFICAEESITDYVIEGAHPDYAGIRFQINKGDVLAVADGRTFEAVKDYDAVKKVSTIMQIEPFKESGDRPMQAVFAAEKIRILLSKDDYKNYILLKVYEGLQHVFACSIVLPVLMEAIRIVKGSDTEQFSDLRWFKNLSSRLEEPGLKKEEDPLTLAQLLLELPLHRALEGAKRIVNPEEGGT